MFQRRYYAFSPKDAGPEAPVQIVEDSISDLVQWTIR